MYRWVATAVLLAAVVLLGGCQGSANVEAPRYSLDVQVSPDDDDANAVICHVILEDTSSGEVVLRPTLLTQWGEPATITQGNEAESFTMTMMADNETQHIEYSAEYLLDGEVVFQSRARVSLVLESDV